MYHSIIIYTVLITFYGAINSKVVASTDNTRNENKTSEHSVSEIHSEKAKVSDNSTCNNNEKNVAFDVILYDNKPLSEINGGYQRNILKRHAPSDSRNSFKDRPREDQKSLLIVFDGTGSMYKDLQQLRSGAEEIINELSKKDNNPIFNYVLVVFRDPEVESPLVTKNTDELLRKLKFINVEGGGDCPERAITGLKIGLQQVLPNSLAFVFSDASSNDYYLKSDVIALIQKKQVTVNFLLTGNCNQKNHNGYTVYHDISRVSNGQVYDMNKNNVKDVLVAIKDTLKPNFAKLKSIDVEHAGTSKTDFNVDKSISELKVSFAGENPRLTIHDPSNDVVKANDELSLNSLKLINIKDPAEGVWKIEASAQSPHSLRLSALSDLKFEFGFSLNEVTKKSETAFQPLVGHKNILTLFLSDTSSVKDLSNITIILIPTSKTESSKQFSIPLKKIKSDVYATMPFDVPIQMFKIRLNGIDVNENAIERLISTGLVSSSGSEPEVNIEVNQKEIYEKEVLQLKCIVKSHIPVDISWRFKDTVLTKIHSNQSNELEYTIQNIQLDNQGVYKCLAVNKINSVTDEIPINVLPLPKVNLIAPDVMVENLDYSLKCSFDKIKYPDIKVKWINENGAILKNDSDILNFTATHQNNSEIIKCLVQNADFSIEDSVNLNVNFSPKFLVVRNITDYDVIYSSNIDFDCSTIENPQKNSIQWFFFPQHSNFSKRIMDLNDTIINITEVYEDHRGYYQCLIKNSIGEASKFFNISLIPKEQPIINTTNNIVLVNESDPVELNCECKNCLPLINFTWSSNNDKNDYEQYIIRNSKEGAFKTVIKFENVDETYNGTYKCSMQNSLGEDEVIIELIVQTTPKIEGILQLTDIENETNLNEIYELLEGKNLSVDCKVNGFPKPTIFWIKDEQIISNGSLLNKENIALSDEGKYECVATNILGTTKKAFQINVNYPPRRKREINSSYEAVVNTKITLTCDLIGNPQPNISWQINSRDIHSNDKFSVESNSLKFTAGPDDSGIFKCIGTNKYGQTTLEFSVIVMTSPKILLPNDESLKIKVNSSIKLTCDATGYPQPTMTFWKDSHLLSNDSFYIKESAQLSNSGSYKCNAENKIGSSQKIFYVTVVEDPKIISEFENITILNNEVREIFCSSLGYPKPTIKWIRHYDDLIISSNPINVNSSFNSGKLSCVAENSEGIDQKFFYIEVLKLPRILPMVTELEKNLTIKENEDIEILCPYENYDNITWTLNGSPLPDIQHKILDKKLYILNANRELNGNWSCIASNEAGVAEYSYHIDILASPIIRPSWNLNDELSDFFYTESDVDEKVFKKGENLKLNCTAFGSPTPKIQWRKGSDLYGEGEVLTINNIDFYHSDIYTCSAENSLGMMKKFFKVDVISAPYLDEAVIIQKSFQKPKGDSVILKCGSVIGNPLPLYFWFKDNEMLDDESDDHLIIENLKSEHAGKYRCLAKNQYGSVKIEFEITIYEPAKIVMIEKNEEHDTNSLSLTCVSVGNPLPILSWTLNGHILSTTSKFNIDKLMDKTSDNTIYFDGYGNGISFLDPFKLNLHANKFYSILKKVNSKTLKLEMKFKNKKSLHLNKFNCYSFNALGKDEKSIEVKINQKPQLKTADLPKVQNFELLENMPLLLSCLITGYPEPQITWYKDGHRVYENETVEFLKNHRFLRIYETFFWNSGNYSCVGKNELGSTEIKFNVVILSPPKIKMQPNANYMHNDDSLNVNSNDLIEEIIEVMKGSSVILECKVEASPKAKIHWIEIKLNDANNQHELLKTEEAFLTLDSVEKSCSFICFANNTIGSAQKIFNIVVQYPPILTKNNEKEEHLSVKLHHSINLECQTKSSPEAITYWSFDSSNLTKSTNDYYFTTDNQIMRITNANKNHEGKYICTSTNKIGWIEKVFYVKVEIPIQYSPWSEWSVCSTSCGSNGVQYRSRTCILLDSTPSYNCTGENIQKRKCNELPCPINGGWGNWTNFTTCPKCYDTTQTSTPKQKRYRKCDNPSPSFGGLECNGNDEEIRECQYLSPCKIDGGWGNWSQWSACSKTCGRGFRNRKRFCNNPAPRYKGKACEGENYEYEECNTKPCSNSALLKSITNDYDESTENYETSLEIENAEQTHLKNYQFVKQREIEVVHPRGQKGYKVKVTLDTYKPISEETYNNHLANEKSDDYDEPFNDYFDTDNYDRIEPTVPVFRRTSVPTVKIPTLPFVRRATVPTIEKSSVKNCPKGFIYNSIYKQCEEVDECKSIYLNNCSNDERCINTIGSYRCEKNT